MKDGTFKQPPSEQDLESVLQIDWSKLKFSDLEKLNQKYVKDEEFTWEEEVLHERWADIDGFLAGDKLWPPIGLKAWYSLVIREVMTRLPQEVFSFVTDKITFVIQDPEFLALNVPYVKRIPLLRVPAEPTVVEVSNDTIILFEKCLKLSQPALMGLIAHEIAHSFVEGSDYAKDEKAADELAVKWGFGKELKALQKKKQEGFPKS